MDPWGKNPFDQVAGSRLFILDVKLSFHHFNTIYIGYTPSVPGITVGKYVPHRRITLNVMLLVLK